MKKTPTQTRRNTVERRSPDSLRLEVAMMNALAIAKWRGERIAGFVAAQRRDGVLSLLTPPYVIELELQIWMNANPEHVSVQTEIDNTLALVEDHNNNTTTK
jgi:hypothetical protein